MEFFQDFNLAIFPPVLLVPRLSATSHHGSKPLLHSENVRNSVLCVVCMGRMVVKGMSKQPAPSTSFIMEINMYLRVLQIWFGIRILKLFCGVCISPEHTIFLDNKEHLFTTCFASKFPPPTSSFSKT